MKPERDHTEKIIKTRTTELFWLDPAILVSFVILVVTLSEFEPEPRPFHNRVHD